LKTEFFRVFASVWLVLSEVPGWPDAPVSVRLRRAAPILVALAGILGLAAWKFGWRGPAMDAARVVHSSVIVLDEEVQSLAMECSDVQATEAAEQARLAADSMLASDEEATAHLRVLRDQIRAAGWEAVFQAYDAAIATEAKTEGLEFVSARGRLTPMAGNAAPFAALLGVFDQISGGNKRIDLIRLGIRADEPGKLEVEINLRIACRPAHEKAS
jgi:hypothetical protein